MPSELQPSRDLWHNRSPVANLKLAGIHIFLLKAHDRMHIGEAVVELAFFSVRLFVLTKAAFDGGAVLCRMANLSQEVP